jgi:HK97 family phage portal protein
MLLIDYLSGVFSDGDRLKYLPADLVVDNDRQRLNKTSVQENKTHIYNCISIISNNFSKLKINIKKDNKIVKNHRLNYQLNHKLNSFQNKQTVYSTLEAHRNEYGNAFLWMAGKNDWRIIPPYLVQDWEVKQGKLIYKIAGTTDIQYKDQFPSEIKAEEVLHFKHISKNGIIGLSPLSAANASIEILNNASSTINSFYKNGAVSNFALESSLSTNDDTNKLMWQDRNKFKSNYAGTNNAGEIIRVPFGHKLTPLSVKFVDVELINTIKFSRDAICSLYQIPNSFLNEQDSTKNIEQDTLSFKAMCISPITNIYEQEMMYKLLTEEEINEGYTIEFDLDSLVEVDTASKISKYKDAIIHGMLTPAQASNKLGFENESEYANKHYVQAQMIPLENFNDYNRLLKDDVSGKGLNDNNLKN